MKALLNGFNRGLISPLALARTDFKRTGLSAETMVNWMPRALGSMMLRPGSEHIGSSRANLPAITIPFIFAIDDTARLEMTEGRMRVWVDDAPVSRPVVTSAVTNGTFNADVSGWTDADEGAAVSNWVAPGFMRLTGTGTAAARRRQLVTCNQPGTRHALNISINRGPVLLRVGSTSGGEQYVKQATLFTGEHSLAFTPTGDFYIEFFNYNPYSALIDSVAVAPAGVMEIAAPWSAGALADLRWDQSGDVVFVACTGYRQRRIERRAVDSWSIVTYQSDTGPFLLQNVGPVTLTPSAMTGDIDLSASAPMFRVGHVGTLFRLTQTGQAAAVSLSGADQWSDPIRITGIDGNRVFAVVITGTFSATVTLQYSIGDPGAWVDAPSGSYTVETAISYDDTLDNQVLFYRIGIKTGDYSSGTAEASISTPSGSQTGIARITTVASDTVANAQVLQPFGDTTATSDWSESYWSAERGYPSAVALYEGRMCWAGRDRLWMSVPDDFANFDDTVEGDSGPISRSIGSGPVDRIDWMMALDQLILGAGGRLWSVRSSSLEEPVTPSNFNMKPCGKGSASVPGAIVDKTGVYVQACGTRLYQVAQGDDYKYGSDDLAKHVPEVGEPSIVRVAVQFQPEVRIHCIRSDGTVAILILDQREDIQCWVPYETDGVVEDIIVEPGLVEDRITYFVRRSFGETTVRLFERSAMESDCRGGAINKQADSCVVATGPGIRVEHLEHLEGRTVVCWADGKDRGEFVVFDGAISITFAQGAVAGLPYEARFKSAKLATIVPDGAAMLCTKQKISRLGIIARDMHPLGLQYGADFVTMDDLPLIEDGARVDTDAVYSEFDGPMFSFDGIWTTDSRLCLRAAAPRPVTLLACLMAL